MGTDGDGKISTADLFAFILIAMDKVDPRAMKDLRSYFHKLDADGTGVLDKDDIIALARRRLKSPQSRSEHAAYRKNPHGIYAWNKLESVQVLRVWGVKCWCQQERRNQYSCIFGSGNLADQQNIRAFSQFGDQLQAQRRV